MNCLSFQNRLYEYVEGSLSASTQAAAARHLAGCSVCRRIVRQEQQLAQFVSSRLQQDTKALRLRPDVRNRILAASEGKSSLPTVPETIAAIWNRFVRLAAVPVSLLLVAAFLLASHFLGARTHNTGTASLSDGDPHPAVSIQISYRMPTCTFRREGNFVVDSLSDETVVASGIFRPGSPESVPSKHETKTPL